MSPVNTGFFCVIYLLTLWKSALAVLLLQCYHSQVLAVSNTLMMHADLHSRVYTCKAVVVLLLLASTRLE